LYVIGEVLTGLRYVHERVNDGRPLGLVHRDVSPHNVLCGFHGAVKLSDFGIAKALGASALTRSGVIRGKLGYASPEQLAGESGAGARAAGGCGARGRTRGPPGQRRPLNSGRAKPAGTNPSAHISSARRRRRSYRTPGRGIAPASIDRRARGKAFVVFARKA